jgi:hypothetical protein
LNHILLWNVLDLIPKQVGDILWCRQIESRVNDAPNNFFKWTIKEKMLYGFLAITKTTSVTPCPCLLNKAILG